MARKPKKDKIILSTSLLMALLLVIWSCREPDLYNESVDSEWLSGGTETVFNHGVGAFSAMFPILSAGLAKVHAIGDGSFGDTYVSAPAPLRQGLGPIYNNVSCTSCHIGDGRGKPPAPGEQLSSLLIRLSIPSTDPVTGGPVAAPGFGLQLQPRAVSGAVPESGVTITYIQQNFAFADGSSYSLQTPTYMLTNPYTALPDNLLMSPRIAPPVFGLGLLEAIDEADILVNADENDVNNDGISGRPNYVWDVLSQKTVLGRFGWKANTSTLLQQTANAFSQDMGITNYIFPQESSYGQPQWNDIDKTYEVSDSLLTSVSFYIRSLGVPARRNAADANVLQGKMLFNSIGCSGCHIAKTATRTDVAFPEISNLTIFPYTDLLLHDMGPALADNRPDYLASGQEWRTPPLWGIGLTEVVNGHNNFLHDGRARSLTEAVMWHGGEAQTPKQNFSNLTAAERAAVITFLQSL